MKVSEVITDRVRQILKDTTTTYLWSDDVLLRWYNDGVMLIRSKRAETRIDDNGDEILYAQASALTDDAILDEKWKPALVDYIASRAFEMDAGDQRDAERSAHHWDNFSRYLEWL